jgi:predicted transcriptional regulator
MKKPTVRPKHSGAGKPATDKPVALTVKIDSKTYVRLSTLRAKERKTGQEMLAEALEAYLDRAGA